MPARYAHCTQSLHIAFTRNTLFGVATDTADCQVQLEAVNLNGQPGVQLQVAPPLPERLIKAHTLVFDWRGHTCRGIVQSTRQCGDGSLQLRLELQ